MKTNIIIAAIFLAACQNVAWAGQDTPVALAGVETVDNGYASKVIAANSGLLIDFRGAAAFAGGTLPGAVNCPGVRQDPTELSEAEIAAAAESVSGCTPVKTASKDREVIAFCGHAQCWVSPKAAMALSRLGFTKVRWLRGGVDAWKAAGGSMQ